jgi:hypothetical protein
MVRLGKTFACGALAAAVVLLMPSLASCQATVPPAQGQLVPGANPASSRPVPTQAPPAPALNTQPSPAASGKPMSAATSQAAKSHGHRAKAAPATQAAPTPPPPPPTLEQSPPTAPQVSLQNGQLTINASNSTMAQVLRAVQARTGASIDIPSTAGNERVVAQLGPGLPRDVLNTLLNGSKFDYVILGVAGDPGGIQKVILTPRQAGTAVNTAQNNNPQPAQEEDSGDDAVADTTENEYQNPDQPPTPPGGLRRPIMPGGQQVDPGAQPAGGEQQNGPKTPEQLMQEMQQLQQQQQNYQQQLNPANQQPPQ